ncbi:MAG: hypothetical protein ACR2QE_11455 [Acidimicrobiales bacterium]
MSPDPGPGGEGSEVDDARELAARLEDGRHGVVAGTAEAVEQPSWLDRWQKLLARRLGELQRRVPVVDTCMRVFERDRDAAGTLLGSALALRLFLFFVPLVLLTVGIFGVIGDRVDIASLSESIEVEGSAAQELDAAFDQDPVSAWLAVLAGVVGIAWTGRSLTRALVLSSALSWRLGGKHKTPLRVVGVVVGLTIGMALIWVIANFIRQRLGIAAASLSFVAIVAVYAVLWPVLFLALPRNTRDPGATLPGAFLIALLLAGMQAFSQLFLPDVIDDATSIYGFAAASVTILGWFFVLGRGLAGAFALNAVVYEQHGSLSGFVFALPVLRLIPQRWAAFARFFDLQPGESRSDRPEG